MSKRVVRTGNLKELEKELEEAEAALLRMDKQRSDSMAAKDAASEERTRQSNMCATHHETECLACDA